MTATPATISAGGTSTLTASCSPAATSYLWIGGSCANSSASCSVTPSATTIYTVAGKNASGSGAVAAATVTVAMASAPVSNQGAVTLNIASYLPHSAGNQWSYVNNNYATKTGTIGSPVTLPNGVVAIPETTVDSSQPENSVDYITLDASGYRLHHSGYIPGYGYTSVTGDFAPALPLAPSSVTVGSTYTSTGTTTITYANVTTFTLNYSIATQIVGFETVSNNAGTQSWSALKLISSLTISGTVNGQFVNDTSVTTVWLVDGLGVVREQSPNASSGVMETWKLTSTNVVPPATAPNPVSSNTGSNPLTGLWWNQNESGWGMSLTQRGSMIFMAWYTYDSTGKPAWYVMSSCPVVGNGCTGDIYNVTGGTPLGVPWNGSGKVVSKVGTGTFTFTDNDTGTFNYSLNGVSGSRNLTRQMFATGSSQPAIDYSALWWNENESGWGVALTQQYGTIFATMYTYDASGNPVWYVASNCPLAGNGCSDDLYQATGGSMPTVTWNGANKVVTKVGTVSLIFNDSSIGTMNYTINGVAGSKAITRQLF